jgi:cytochrome c
MRMIRLAVLVYLAAAVPLLAQDLRGHGGPVRALAVGAQGQVYSGSFDTRAIVWQGAEAIRITRFHEGAVTAVLPLAGGGFASGGQDGKVAIWGEGPEPLVVHAAHMLPVAALAPWQGGLASAGWDGRIVLYPPGGAPVGIDAHDGQITGMVAYAGGLASTGADLRLRLWDKTGAPAGQFDLAAPASALATDGQALFLASPDGSLTRYETGQDVQQVQLSARPLLSVAAGADTVVAAGTTGEIWMLDAQRLRTTVTVQSGQGPVWALALAGETLLSGGTDGVIRRWQLDGTPLGEGTRTAEITLTSPRGAEVFRACAVCHTLTPGDGARAGPTLHGLFGRRIGTAAGYDYSRALRGMDIVWTPQTVSALFEFGPDAYTPGSRMPEQHISSESDRAALIRFLETATR